MKTLLQASEWQTAFVAPMPGAYRFVSFSEDVDGPVFRCSGEINTVIQTIGGGGVRIFIAEMSAGAVMQHTGGACRLIGAREADEVPEE